MYITIESEVHKDWGYGLEFRYYVDMDNTWWYCYEDICDYIELNQQVADKIYRHKLQEEDKITVYDKNHKNEQKECPQVVRYFISSNAVRYMVKRNNKRNSRLIKVMNNLEFVSGAHEIFNDNEELKERINVLGKSIEKYDYEEIFYQAKQLVESESGKDILDKMGVIDKDKESLIEQIRHELYDYDENIEEVQLTMRNLNEEKKVKFKKSGTQIPEWLSEVVK